MKRTQVSKNFIELSLEMAEDLYGLADMNGSKDIKKRIKYHINCCEKYLNKIEDVDINK